MNLMEAKFITMLRASNFMFREEFINLFRAHAKGHTGMKENHDQGKEDKKAYPDTTKCASHKSCYCILNVFL